jgi:predicted permease
MPSAPFGRTGAFAFTAIVSIGLAIGANSAIFGFIDALLLRPLPVTRASDVVSLRQIEPTASASGLANLGGAISYPDFVYFKENNKSFVDLLAYHLVPAGFAPDARTQPQLRMGYVVSANFFRVLGVKLQLGREFSADEDRVPGRDSVVILDHGFWKREFASDSSIVGRRVKLGGMDFTVIGVAPESFTGLDSFVHPFFYAPIMMAGKFPLDADVLTNRASRRFDVKGRLKSGVSIETAAREAAVLAKSLEQAYPDSNRGFGATVLTESQFRFERVPVYRTVVVSLFGLVLIVLLIACCNVANLMLGRGKSRAREIAVRLAIGASRSRLVRQLTERERVFGRRRRSLLRYVRGAHCCGTRLRADRHGQFSARGNCEQCVRSEIFRRQCGRQAVSSRLALVVGFVPKRGS